MSGLNIVPRCATGATMICCGVCAATCHRPQPGTHLRSPMASAVCSASLSTSVACWRKPPPRKEVSGCGGDPHMSRFQRNPMKRLEHRSLTSSPDFVARKSAETLIRASRIADTKRWDLNGFDQGYRETSRDIECYFP